jgi:type II secretory pathway component PulJ
MRSKSVCFRIKSAFTILEAVVSVALIGIATAAAFQVMKVVSSGKYSLDDRHNIYLAALSFSTNLDLALMEMTSADIQTISPGDVVFTTGVRNGSPAPQCPANNGNLFRDRLKNELCKTTLIVNPLRTQATQQLRILLANTVTTQQSVKYLETRLTFVHPTTGVILFEKVLLHVK